MVKHNLEEVDNRLSTHEEICAYRYETINARLKRLEQILLGGVGAVLLLLISNLLK
jgi:hypothetical protein